MHENLILGERKHCLLQCLSLAPIPWWSEKNTTWNQFFWHFHHHHESRMILQSLKMADFHKWGGPPFFWMVFRGESIEGWFGTRKPQGSAPGAEDRTSWWDGTRPGSSSVAAGGDRWTHVGSGRGHVFFFFFFESSLSRLGAYLRLISLNLNELGVITITMVLNKLGSRT